MLTIFLEDAMTFISSIFFFVIFILIEEVLNFLVILNVSLSQCSVQPNTAVIDIYIFFHINEIGPGSLSLTQEDASPNPIYSRLGKLYVEPRAGYLPKQNLSRRYRSDVQTPSGFDRALAGHLTNCSEQSYFQPFLVLRGVRL